MGFLYIRIEKTERAIKQAFMELRREKPVEKIRVKAVSYTHLDVYKRQVLAGGLLTADPDGIVVGVRCGGIPLHLLRRRCNAAAAAGGNEMCIRDRQEGASGKTGHFAVQPGGGDDWECAPLRSAHK